MGKSTAINILESIGEYNDEFINSISLKDVSSVKELRLLLNKLEKANYVVTMYYQTLYNDYVMAINSDCSLQSHGINVDTLLKYKSIASRIQKAYKYIMYIMFLPTKLRKKSKKAKQNMLF